MSLESKRVVVAPEQETAAIDVERSFGWNLKSRNEVLDSKEVFDGAYSYSYGGIGGGVVNTHKEETHFVSLLFERDRSMAFYSELVQAQGNYLQAVAAYQKASQSFEDKNKRLRDKKAELQGRKENYLGWIRPMVFGILFITVYFVLCGCITAELSYPAIWAIAVGALLIGILFILLGFYNRYQLHHALGDLEVQEKAVDKELEEITKTGVTSEWEKIQEWIDLGNSLVDKSHAKQPKIASSPQDPLTELGSLKQAHDQGLLTDDEYTAKKTELLTKI